MITVVSYSFGILLVFQILFRTFRINAFFFLFFSFSTCSILILSWITTLCPITYFVSTVAYINVTSLMAKFEIFVLLLTHGPTIIMLSATWLTSFITDALISLDGYTIFRSDRFEKRVAASVPTFLIFENFTVTSLAVNTGGIDSLFLKVTSCSTTHLCSMTI